MNELIEVNIETLNQLPTRDKYTALKKWQKWNRNQTILLKKEMILEGNCVSRAKSKSRTEMENLWREIGEPVSEVSGEIQIS